MMILTKKELYAANAYQFGDRDSNGEYSQSPIRRKDLVAALG